MMTTNLEILVTPRQLELLALIANGYDMVAIGGMKHLSPHTVRNALYAARDRVGAKNLTHLAVLCVDTGLIVREGDEYIPNQPEGVVGE
jgi:DNA-binding CsgD family transcriptional regulator